MVNISIYPYGLAEEHQDLNGTWKFNCQHGVDECDGNLVETCFINLVSFDQNKFMDFIINYENNLHRNKHDPYGVAQQLLENGNYSITWNQLNSCINSKQGNEWEHQMGLWTNKQNVNEVPYILLNGKHTFDNSGCIDSTLSCTCNVYTGTNSCCKRYKQ